MAIIRGLATLLEYFAMEIFAGICYRDNFTTSLNFNNLWHVRVMEEELVIELCVRGYHVYKNIWEAAVP